MSETPERKGRTSRVSTPHSRRNSKTPVRTPSRRRATIVSASLITPRRNRRPSGTPQNILRNLSRAFVRQGEVPQQEQNQPATPEYYYSDIEIDEDFDKVPINPNDSETGDHSDHYRDDIDDVNLNEQLTSEIYHPSDIAQPISIMPDTEIERSMQRQEDDLNDDLNDDNNEEIDDGLDDIMGKENIEPTQEDNNEINEKPIIKAKRERTTTVKNIKNFTLSSKAISSLSRTTLSKTLNKECLSTIAETTELFFDQLSDDLLAYTEHSKQKSTIDLKTINLLFKRQRKTNSIESFLQLIDDNLPLEDVLEIRKNIIKLIN